MSTDSNGSGALAPRRALAAATGKEKLDVLLSAPDPEALVQSIPEQDLYLAILEIGPDDAAEVVALSSPSQFRHAIDLSAWPGRDKGPDPATILRWLRLAREGAGHSDRAGNRYREKLAGLDAEMLSLTLRRILRVHDLNEEPDPAVQETSSTYRTPEGRYLVEVLEGTDYAMAKGLLDDLYAEDVLGTTRLLESLRWEVPTELEEIARRWRDGRLRDLGFPDLDEAASFYARPAAAKSAPEPSPGPALLVPVSNLLERALEELSGEERERAEEGILYASNAALVANAVRGDDFEELRDTLADARATLALGLEILSGGDLLVAARVLAERPVRQIFQTGVGEAYRVQARARRAAAAARLPQAQSATLLDPPLSHVVDALSRTRPEFPSNAPAYGLRPGSGGAGALPAAPRTRRALGSRAEVARAEDLLAEAEAVPAILGALGLSPAALGPIAEAQGLTPTAVRASDAVRALVLKELRGLSELPLRESAEDRPAPPGFAEKLGELLDGAVPRSGHPRAAAAAQRIREVFQDGMRDRPARSS
ncbi:MAG: DUF6178 family protein [Myxococcales bacterium]